MSHEVSCRRTGIDRRQVSWRTLISFYRSRRRGDRRASLSTTNTYVDVHSPLLFLIAMLIILLCLFDAGSTLILIEHGSRELNPFLAWFLERSVMDFFLVKYILTVSCIIYVIAHKDFRFFGLFSGYHVLVFALLQIHTE